MSPRVQRLCSLLISAFDSHKSLSSNPIPVTNSNHAAPKLVGPSPLVGLCGPWRSQEDDLFRQLHHC
ncbi:hypothetical protein BFJ70_g17311 [Fusarium oxysporum]|nr:hypothetical protein BFJ67_g17463 [Fusarium oxysporum f. sp. cepae]RKK21302.1 hypothetical protein BFJ66_g17639 [Fusarium oxysporum f. sp. cepae]RKL02998.1 hypothetical protein BFJ70_g17311 [Fusarium oxysporum]